MESDPYDESIRLKYYFIPYVESPYRHFSDGKIESNLIQNSNRH